MAKATLYELALDLTLNSANLETGVNRVTSKLNEFELNARNIGSMITKTLSFAGIGVGIAGLFSTIKSSIESVEGPGDRFAATMAGGKEALGVFQRALGNMNFSNLIKDLIEGYKRGKELNEQLDDLADRKSFNDYRVSQLEREAAALRETSKNRQLDIKERADVAEQIRIIEEKILKRKNVLINREYDITKGDWEKTYKMTVEQSTAAYDFVESLSEEKGKRLADAFAGSYENQFHDMKKTIQSIMFGQYDPTLMKEFSKKDLETYSLYFKVNEGGKADPWKTLFEFRGKYEGALTETQNNYNGAIRETSAILSKEEIATKKSTDAIKEKTQSLWEMITAYAEISTLKYVAPDAKDNVKSDYGSLVDPEEAAGFGILPDPKKEFDILNKSEENWSGYLTRMGTMVQSTASAFDSLANSITNASKDGAVSFGGAMDIIKNLAFSTISILGALAAAHIIAAESSKGLIGIATAVAGLAMLAGVWASFVDPKKYANGTDFASGGWAMVGERGKELVNLPRGSQVLNNRQTSNMLAGPSSVLIKFQDGSLQGYMDYQNRKINASR